MPTDDVALCCYFDRVARLLTLGESHSGMRRTARRHVQAEELALCCYGVDVRLVDAAGLGLCRRLRDTLPPEFVAPFEQALAAVAYIVTATVLPGTAEPTEYLVTCDGVEVFATAAEEEVYWWLRRDIEQAVAQRSPRLLFVHAGVIGWRGLAIVIPGRGSAGKSTLVAELVRQGAVYYSDAFAVLDEAGRVHPYRRTIGLAYEGHPHDLRLVREDGPAEPLPLGLIVAGCYRPGVAWRPTVVRGAHAALPLVDSTVLARDEAARMPQIAARLAPTVVTLRGPRPEAAEVAAQLLDLVDDALVSHALGADQNGSSHLPDDVARVAEIRLRSQPGRPVTPPRRLIAARYVQKTDFLCPAEHRRLLEHVRAYEGDFRQSGIVGPEGQSELIDESRKSRTLSDARLGEVWDMFDRRLRALLPFVRQQLEIAWFPLGRVEWQLTAHGRGGFFAPHVDTGGPKAAGRRVSCVYYFHASPRRYTGGELKLYDTWVTPTGSTAAETYTTLAPVDNTVVFFPSDAFHEVCPIYPETETLGDSRFAIAIWVWEGERPARAGDIASHTIDAAGHGSSHLTEEPARVAEIRPRSLPMSEASSSKRRPRNRRLVAIVTPQHRFPLSADEQISLRHLREHLGGFDRYMIGPHIPPEEFSDFALPPLSARYFADRAGYNRLLVSERFYRAFEEYEYILIYQLDCLVFSSNLEEWCRNGWDYIGAPWFERWHQRRCERLEDTDDPVDGFGTVGNGGFSLRKIDTALAVLTSTNRPLYDRLMQGVLTHPQLNEDIFWSFSAPKLVDSFRIPRPREALKFSFETEPRYCYRENSGRLPFGCHGWPVYEREFWVPFLLK